MEQKLVFDKKVGISLLILFTNCFFWYQIGNYDNLQTILSFFIETLFQKQRSVLNLVGNFKKFGKKISKKFGKKFRLEKSNYLRFI